MIWLWLLKNWKVALGSVGALALLVSLGWMTHSRNEWRSTAKDSVAALTLSAERLKTASAQALANANANVIRVKTEQEKITTEIENEHQAKLAATADRYQRLLDKARAYSSNAGDATVSATREATCNAYAGTNCDRIPTLLKAAQDNTDQLIDLQGWVARQAKVNSSSER